MLRSTQHVRLIVKELKMPSIRSRLFLGVIRNSHLLRFKLKRQSTFDFDSSIEEFRAQVDKTPALFGKLPDHMQLESVMISDLYAEWLRHVEAPQDEAILYFHGGGYVSGTCEAHRTHVSKVVNGSHINALTFQYRVAPEHPFPAALDDALAAYRCLLDQGFAPQKIAFMGDSAGGGLCLATLNAIKDKKLPMPAVVVALSPWTDLACTGDSYQTNAATCLSPTGSWTVFSSYYVGEADATNPWISPLYGSLAGLPPMRIYVGSDEVMLDDAVQYAEKAKAAGVDVTLTVGEGLFHCYPICAPAFPEATEALAELCKFMKQHVAKEQVVAIS
jgi:monoterpene epsilon-lactone hydrolase